MKVTMPETLKKRQINKLTIRKTHFIGKIRETKKVYCQQTIKTTFFALFSLVFFIFSGFLGFFLRKVYSARGQMVRFWRGLWREQRCMAVCGRMWLRVADSWWLI